MGYRVRGVWHYKNIQIIKERRCVSMANLVVFAAEAVGSMDSIKSAMSSAFQTVQTDSLSMIATALPFGLTVMGAVLAITMGIRVFKKVTKS